MVPSSMVMIAECFRHTSSISSVSNGFIYLILYMDGFQSSSDCNNADASRGLNHYAEQIINENKFEEVNKFLRYDMKIKYCRVEKRSISPSS